MLHCPNEADRVQCHAGTPDDITNWPLADCVGDVRNLAESARINDVTDESLGDETLEETSWPFQEGWQARQFRASEALDASQRTRCRLGE